MKFILGYRNSEDWNNEILTEFNSKEEADYESDEWCEVDANSLEEAKLKYEESFLNWQKQITIRFNEKENNNKENNKSS